MKGIEFPLLDFSLFIFTLHKKFLIKHFFIQLSKFKERLKFQLIRTTPFLQFEKIRLNEMVEIFEGTAKQRILPF